MQRKPQSGPDAGSREAQVSRIATQQHGVVTRTQLVKCGLRSGAIAHRIASGRLHQIHRGVYLLGHRSVTWRSLELAATLACGPDSVLSHRSAARFWKLLPYPAQPDLFEVTVTARPRARRNGVRVHSDALERRECMIRDGIRVTNPARTLLDLAGQVSETELATAVNEAHVQRLGLHTTLLHLISENRGRPGIRALRSICGDELRLTRSVAERRFLSLLRESHLPLPETNVRVAGHEVDFVWRGERLVVETDGWAAHSSRAAFERDRRRDAELAARGFQVIRVTWRRLATEPGAMLGLVARALAPRPRRTAGSAWR